MRGFALLILALCASAPALARDYDVELIVFERTHVSGDVEEQWNPGSNSQLSNQETLREFIARRDPQDVLPDTSRLQRLQSELQRSGYRVLYSGRWRQPAAVFQNAPVVTVGGQDSRLDGAIRVYRTSLIFADIALGLEDVGADSLAPLYFINEKRRLKFQEVHYFDHPRFGALLTVWPAEG